MNIQLHDGTLAHLNAVVLTRNYRQGYTKQPPDSVAEIKRLAKKHMPCWPEAPMILIGMEDKNLDELLQGGNLPPVMCVGEFVSYRHRAEGLKKAVFLHVIWLQEDLAVHMSPANEAAFKRIDWDVM